LNIIDLVLASGEDDEDDQSEKEADGNRDRKRDFERNVTLADGRDWRGRLGCVAGAGVVALGGEEDGDCGEGCRVVLISISSSDADAG
jgi:hypothetical protein